MRVVAVLAVANERPYLANCLSHLIANGIDYAVVDNGSTDGSAELLREPRFARHLAGYSSVPFEGAFAWKDILLAQKQLIQGIEADWQMLLAPDEIMHSYVPGEPLAQAIERLDRQGFDVINFDEFVFLPVDGDYMPDHDGPQPLRWYYLHQPRRPHHMRAWRKAANLSNVDEGGHRVSGSEFRLAPESFALRHYIFLSQAHAFEKYTRRVFAANEVEHGWHRNRVNQPAANFAFPPVSELEFLADPRDRNLNRDRPRDKHYWLRWGAIRSTSTAAPR
jgi:hypothetical protein